MNGLPQTININFSICCTMSVTPDALLDLMKSRRSIRDFKPEPWRFIVVKSKAIIIRLCKCATYGNFIDKAPVVIALVGDKTAAPNWHVHDTSMASHQICLMAWALGIGTCWIGTMDRDKAAAILGLANHEFLTTILPLGYPASIPKPPTRKELDSLMTFRS
jgi:nitroreductase